VLSVQSILSFVFAALAFSMLLFSPFGPLDSSFIPFHPIGWAGIFVYFAMLSYYSQRYRESKDIFWFLLVVMFFPNFVSDLYFFPIPKLFGFGMIEWMGVQMGVCCLCFVIFSRVKVLRYANLVLVMFLPVAAGAYLFPQFGLHSEIQILALLYIVVIGVSLSYYAFLRKEYLLMTGVILNFLIANIISALYTATGILLFDWSQLFMAVVTDRIAIFGRILMVINLIVIRNVWRKYSNTPPKSRD
jgi:hypothetical protein